MADTVTSQAHGSPTGPALGATLCQLTGLAPSLYEVYAFAYLTGTVTAGDSDNVALVADTITVATLPVVPVASQAQVPLRFVVSTQAGTIKLVSPAAGGASCVYHVFLSAAPIPLGEYR